MRDESNTVIDPVCVDACKETPRPIPFVKRMVSSRGLLLIAVVVLGAWLMLRGVDAIGGGAVLRDRYGFASATILVPLHAIVAVSPFPGELVAFGNSILFGFWLGTVCNWLGWMAAAVIQYGLARRMAQDFDFGAATLRRTRWLRTIPVHHPVFLIVGRWLPFGGHLVNTAAGACSVPLWRHVWCAAISILPVALLVAAAATLLSDS